MNKKKVEKYLPHALEAIKDCKIAQGDSVIKTYRSNISGFGAAVTLGSFKAAVAFYSSDANTNGNVKRSKLIQAMDYIVKGKNERRDIPTILKEVINGPSEHELKDQYLDASIALKLAMNAYDLIDPDKPKTESKSENEES